MVNVGRNSFWTHSHPHRCSEYKATDARAASTAMLAKVTNGDVRSRAARTTWRSHAWWTLDPGWNPSGERRRGMGAALRDVISMRTCKRKRRRCRRTSAAAGTGRAGSVLVVPVLIARQVRMRVAAGESLRLLRRHAGIVAVIHWPRSCIRCRRVRHRAGDVDRGSHALRGQRHDQYPQHEGVHEGTHVDQSSIGEVPQSHDTAPQHARVLLRTL